MFFHIFYNVFLKFIVLDDNEKFKKSIEEEEEGEGSGERISDEKELKNKQHQTINPKIHTFRVISACDAISCCDNNNKEKSFVDDTTTKTRTATPTATTTAAERNNKTNILYCCIQKPILMCFICKLSFGNTKSFILHSNTEHQLNLPELERNLLKLETYSSAIIQRSMDEKPQVSFLQPLNLQLTNNELTQAIENQQQQQQQQKQSQQQQHEQTIIDKKDNNENANNLSKTPLATSIKKELEEVNEQDQVQEKVKEKLKLKQKDEILSDKLKEEVTIGTDELSDNIKLVNTTTITTKTTVHNFNVPQPPQLPLALPTTPPNSTFSAHFVDFLHDNFNTTPTTIATTPTTQLPLQQNFLLNNQTNSNNNNHNNNNNNNEEIQNNLKFVNDFFETKFLLKQQQQHQQQECDTNLSDENDPATATTRTTPTLSISTTTSPFNQQQQQQQTAAAAAASLTIGACPEHANGRPVGVDCMR